MIKLYVIYERPEDFPDGYVMREWLLEGETAQPGDDHQAATLEAVRKFVPAGAVRVDRMVPDPDPTIIEVWM